MITRFLLRLALVAMAVAAGVALDVGILDDDEPVSVDPAASAPAPVVDDLPTDLAVEALAALNANGLKDSGVVMVTLPGADPDTVDGIESAVTEARGTLTATVALGAQLTDPTQKMLATSLGDQLAEEVADSSDLEGYAQIGHLLGRAAATRRSAVGEVDEQTRVLRQGLATASFVDGLGLRVDRAPAVVVVSGDDVDPDILSGLLEGLTGAARTVLVSGVSNDAAVETARAIEADNLSTFDGNQTPAGQQATVAVVIAQLDESGGDFGASGSDGSAPVR